MGTRLSRAMTFAGVLLISVAATNAGLLDTQSNLSTAVSADPYNPASWASVPTYELEPGDAAATQDLNFISMAHDEWWLYVRMNVSGTSNFGGDWNIWMDTDTNPGTGVRHWGGNLSIGAEYLVTGAALVEDLSAWNVHWTIGWAFYNNGSTQDAILAIPRSDLADVTSFDFVGHMYNSSAGMDSDWYSDNALSQSGDYFRYSFVEIPEPASVALIAMGGAMILRRRSH